MRKFAIAMAGFSLISCPRSNSDAGTSQASHRSKEAEVNVTRYYRDFDKFQLEGIRETAFPPLGDPYVSVTRDQAGSAIDLEVHVGSAEPFLVNYTRRGDAFVKARIKYAADEPEYQYEEQVCHVQDGVEHCYTYLYNRDPEQYDETPLLYEYHRASPDEVQIWIFDPFSKKSAIREEIPFAPETPLPPRVARCARAIKTIRFAESERRLVAEHIYQPMKDGEPDGDPSTRHEMFNVEKFSRFFLDFAEASMFIMEHDPDRDP